nr:macrophage mannose receptor 1-like [Leptinotarsa decemlineata]
MLFWFLFSVLLLRETLGADIGGSISTGNLFLGTEKVTRDEAEKLCKMQSMELVSIQNPEKNKAIFELLQNNDFNDAVWTSGNKHSDGSFWTWSNGSNITFFNWYPGEPNSARGDESCLEVFKKNNDVFWNDQPCGDKRAYICEKTQNECADTILEGVSVDDKICYISTSPDSNLPTKKFYLSTQTATYAEAKKLCSDMFMELAELRCEYENDDLYKLMSEKGTQPYWIGGKRKAGEQWKWSNDEPITYFNWRKGEPNGAKNSTYCLEVIISGKKLVWNDNYCSSKRHFVCEKKDPVVKINVTGKLIVGPEQVCNEEGNNCEVIMNIQK